MHILDVGAVELDKISDSDLARLARLMHNFECGFRKYEWGPGSSAEPNAGPCAPILSIAVPGVTAGAPPAVLNLRPAAAFIYYVPGGDLAKLVSRIRDHLDALPDDHLRGYLPMETATRATLHCSGREWGESEIVDATTDGRVDEWVASQTYPVRRYSYAGGGVGWPVTPSHISKSNGFVWHFRAAAYAVPAGPIDRFEEFNAVISGIFLNPYPEAMELASPTNDLTYSTFGISPAPTEILVALRQCEPVLVYDGGRFYLADGKQDGNLRFWSLTLSDPCRRTNSEGLNVANVAPGVIGDGLCGLCKMPLWGNIYVIADAIIDPYSMAVCRWCAGCLPEQYKTAVEHIVYDRTQAEAYAGTKYAALLPLLEAKVEIHETEFANYYLVTPDIGEKSAPSFCLKTRADGGPGPVCRPPCLLFPELRECRVPCLAYPKLTRLTIRYQKLAR